MPQAPNTVQPTRRRINGLPIAAASEIGDFDSVAQSQEDDDKKA